MPEIRLPLRCCVSPLASIGRPGSPSLGRPLHFLDTCRHGYIPAASCRTTLPGSARSPGGQVANIVARHDDAGAKYNNLPACRSARPLRLRISHNRLTWANSCLMGYPLVHIHGPSTGPCTDTAGCRAALPRDCRRSLLDWPQQGAAPCRKQGAAQPKTPLHAYEEGASVKTVTPGSDLDRRDREDREIRDALRNWPRTLRFCVIRLSDRVPYLLLWWLFSRR
jgi:hypothetical protein